MSSFLWLLLYLVPLLGLTAAIFAWFGWQWRGNDLLKRIQARERELAGLLSDLERLRAAHADTQAELAGLREVAAAEPAGSESKPKRKRPATGKSKGAAATASVSLREIIGALETRLAAFQASSPEPDALGEIERLQTQIRVLLNVEAGAAGLAEVPDDDLTQIKGIKRGTSEQLRAHGIRTWRQIALWNEQEQRAFSELLGLKNRAIREQWQEQARALHAAAHGTLL